MREAADLIDVAFARQTEPRKIKKEPTGMKEEEETTKIQHLRKIPTNAIGAWIAEGAQTIPTKKNCDEERMRLFERIGMFDGTGEINRTELEDALTEPTYEATRNFITLKAIQHRHQESATREQADKSLYNVLAMAVLDRDQVALFGERLEHARPVDRLGSRLLGNLRRKMLEASGSARDEALRRFTNIQMKSDVEEYYSEFMGIVTTLTDYEEKPSATMQRTRFIQGLTAPFRSSDGTLISMVHDVDEITYDDTLNAFYSKLRARATRRGLLDATALRKTTNIGGRRINAYQRPLAEVECFHCKTKGHYKSSCPEIKCFACNKNGHIAKRCKNKANEPTVSNGEFANKNKR